MCLEILHKLRKRQDQNDKARFLFRFFAFYRNKTKPFSSSRADPLAGFTKDLRMAEIVSIPENNCVP